LYPLIWVMYFFPWMSLVTMPFLKTPNPYFMPYHLLR
jgi:hypothetical protein